MAERVSNFVCMTWNSKLQGQHDLGARVFGARLGAVEGVQERPARGFLPEAECALSPMDARRAGLRVWF